MAVGCHTCVITNVFFSETPDPGISLTGSWAYLLMASAGAVPGGGFAVLLVWFLMAHLGRTGRRGSRSGMIVVRRCLFYQRVRARLEFCNLAWAICKGPF